jgi:hypothetical protein
MITCPFCGREFADDKAIGSHLTLHCASERRRPVPGCASSPYFECWCGNLLCGESHLGLHLALHGGLQAHLLRLALDLDETIPF